MAGAAPPVWVDCAAPDEMGEPRALVEAAAMLELMEAATLPVGVEVAPPMELEEEGSLRGD